MIDNGADFDPGITIPNGGWNAPLADLEKYLAFLTNSAHGDTALQARYDAVLPHRDLEEMWRPYLTMTPEALRSSVQALAKGNTLETTGISFFVVRRGTGTFIGHTGSQAGFTAFIYLNPVHVGRHRRGVQHRKAGRQRIVTIVILRDSRSGAGPDQVGSADLIRRGGRWRDRVPRRAAPATSWRRGP